MYNRYDPSCWSTLVPDKEECVLFLPLEVYPGGEFSPDVRLSGRKRTSDGREEIVITRKDGSRIYPFGADENCLVYGFDGSSDYFPLARINAEYRTGKNTDFKCVDMYRNGELAEYPHQVFVWDYEKNKGLWWYQRKHYVAEIGHDSEQNTRYRFRNSYTGAVLSDWYICQSVASSLIDPGVFKLNGHDRSGNWYYTLVRLHETEPPEEIIPTMDEERFRWGYEMLNKNNPLFLR